MPITHELPSETEPGTTYSAWTWGPRLRIDAESQMIVIEYVSYASTDAAYGGGRPVATNSLLLAGKDFRNWVRRNPSIYIALTTAVDAAAASVPALAGGTVVAGQLPAWASDPIED